MSLILQQHKICGKNIYIVENHHHVLIPWAMERQQMSFPLISLTIDHHHDTLPPFRFHTMLQTNDNKCEADILGKEMTKKLSYWKLEQLEEQLQILRHDEHLALAIEMGMLKKAAVFPHENYAIDVHNDIAIIYDNPGGDDIDIVTPYYQQVLETNFLKHNIKRLKEEYGITIKPQEFILDIDLDCFKSERSIMPHDTTLFYQLIRDCRCITISMERTWVKILNMDYEKLNADFFLDKMLLHIEKALAK